MRAIMLAALFCAVSPAGTIAVDRISVDVGSAELVSDLLGPGSLSWRTKLVLWARLTNTGTDTLYLDGIGGGSGIEPTIQLQPDTYLNPGGVIEGAMFSKNVFVSFGDGAYLTDEQIVNGVSGSGIGVYSADLTPLGQEWLVPPTWDPTRWPVPFVEVRRFAPQDDVVSTPEPASCALIACGLLVLARRYRGNSR